VSITWNIWKFIWKGANEKRILKQLVWEDGNKGIISVVRKRYKDIVSSVLDARLYSHFWEGSLTTVSEIGDVIDVVVKDVKTALQNSGKKEKRFRNVNSFKYRMFLKWMLWKLEQKGFKADIKKLKDVPDKHWEGIFHILQDRALTSFFMIGKAFWLLDYSNNIVNTFPEENEIKVLDVSRDKVKEWLDLWEWVNILEDEEEVDIEDKYYDDINLRLDRQKVFWMKRSFRIRTKKYKSKSKTERFYTIKRKKDDKTKKSNDSKNVNSVEVFNKDNFDSRRCDEKEFKIKKPKIFKWFLESIGLRNSRTKRKNRKSYSIEFEFNGELIEAKLDIDKYKWIPEFLEIECEDDDAIPYIIEQLWLDKDENGNDINLAILKVGSRWLYRYYGKEADYDKEYKVDKKTGEVKWKNWDVWNCKIHKAIKKPRTWKK